MRLNSWEEVNEALRQIGENQRDMQAAESVMNEQIASAKAAADSRVAPLRENTKMLEAALKEFSIQNRADMGKLKSRQMTFGVVSFRQSTKISIPNAAGKLVAIIEKLRERGMEECIVQQQPKVDKNALRKYRPDEIIAVGASIQTDETFGYEVDTTQISEL